VSPRFIFFRYVVRRILCPSLRLARNRLQKH
jgi:hypothetical protein